LNTGAADGRPVLGAEGDAVGIEPMEPPRSKVGVEPGVVVGPLSDDATITWPPGLWCVRAG
jgi:hypothetical protein